MAGYNGQRGPNVSEFIANLNAIPSAQDIAGNGQGQEGFSLDDELAMFTNTQFFDFDLGQDADLQPSNFDFNGPARLAPVPAPADIKDMDFTQGDYSFPDFGAFQPQDGFSAAVPPPPIQTSQPLYASTAVSSPQSGLVSPQNGPKPIDGITDSRYMPGFEDASRVAAEEDKRRRNTAASARFRVKKKQREQALEKSAKEMSDKVAALEGRINQLETENKWLKNLVVEKNENKDDIAALWKKYNQDTAERKASGRKDGVGTTSTAEA